MNLVDQTELDHFHRVVTNLERKLEYHRRHHCPLLLWLVELKLAHDTEQDQ